MQTINLNKLDLQDQQLAIDLGCGLGRHMHAMYFHRRCTAVGLDLGHEDVTATREGFKNTPDLEPQVGAPRHYVLSVGTPRNYPFLIISLTDLFAPKS